MYFLQSGFFSLEDIFWDSSYVVVCISSFFLFIAKSYSNSIPSFAYITINLTIRLFLSIWVVSIADYSEQNCSSLNIFSGNISLSLLLHNSKE